MALTRLRLWQADAAEGSKESRHKEVPQMLDYGPHGKWGQEEADRWARMEQSINFKSS